MTTVADTSCPVCGIDPVNGFISHKHDCPFHQRRVKAELEVERKKQKRERRRYEKRRRMSQWKTRAGEVALVVAVIAVGLILMFLGFEWMEER